MEASEQVTLTLPAQLAQYLRRRKPPEMQMSEWLTVLLIAKSREENLASGLEKLAIAKAEVVSKLAKERAEALAKLAAEAAAELVDVAKRLAQELADNALCLCGSGKPRSLCCDLAV